MNHAARKIKDGRPGSSRQYVGSVFRTSEDESLPLPLGSRAAETMVSITAPCLSIFGGTEVHEALRSKFTGKQVRDVLREAGARKV